LKLRSPLKPRRLTLLLRLPRLLTPPSPPTLLLRLPLVLLLLLAPLPLLLPRLLPLRPLHRLLLPPRTQSPLKPRRSNSSFSMQ
jgi:hypothetical protein